MKTSKTKGGVSKGRNKLNKVEMAEKAMSQRAAKHEIPVNEGKSVRKKLKTKEVVPKRVWNVRIKDEVTYIKRKREFRKLDPKAQAHKIRSFHYNMRRAGVNFKYVVRATKAAYKEKKANEKRRRKEEQRETYRLICAGALPIQEDDNDGTDLSNDKVKDAVRALLDLLENNDRPKKIKRDEAKLFGHEGKDIYLQITSFKVPKTAPREIRIVLPHSLLPENPDVCLISSDLQRGRRIDHEPTLEHVKDILMKNGVKRINEVITVRQLRTEYDQYELKRALCNRFDMFLCEAKVCGFVSHHLGKTFYARKKLPVPIVLNKENLKDRIETALHKSSVRVTNKGTLFSLKIAHSFLTPQQIYDNIMAATVKLADVFPGGWNNILHLMIKGARSLPVPFYMSTMKINSISGRDVKPYKRKHVKNAYGDLPGVGIVRVQPCGKVDVIEKDYPDEIELKTEWEERKERKQRAKEEKDRKLNDARANEMRLKKRKLEIKKVDKSEPVESEDEASEEVVSNTQIDGDGKSGRWKNETGEVVHRSMDGDDGDDDDDDDGDGDDDNDNDNDNEEENFSSGFDKRRPGKRRERLNDLEMKYLESWNVAKSVEDEPKSKKRRR